MIIPLRSTPIRMRSRASSKSVESTAFLPLLAAMRAASLTRLASSAPVKPGHIWAIWLRSRSSAILILSPWILRILRRPLMSGGRIVTCRSKRPGRRRAESRMSGLFVAARTIMLSVEPKPSISTSRAFRVWLLSSLPLADAPPLRLPPTASISSIKTMQGAFFFASLKRSRTREAPTPTNISTKSDPLKL